MKVLAVLVTLLLVSAQPHTDTWKERDWNKWIAETRGMDRQHVTVDGSYVDLLSDTHAYELDYADKWQEAIGQALYYGIATGKEPGVILLMGKGELRLERVYYLRCLTVCAKYGIKLEAVNVREHIP